MDRNFLPISKKDLEDRGWTELDVILVTGDAYVDHPTYGAAVIGRVLEDRGFRVGVIAQPDWRKPDDFLKLGRPKLFFGITAGNLDSMLANYTANKKIRSDDDYSPGGKAGLRPNRATAVYANRVKELFPGVPVVLGGIEASLRRLAHYCYWDDDVRRSILLDAKADLLIYGMGERPVVEVAERLRNGEEIKALDGIRGTVVVRSQVDGLAGFVKIPSYEEVKADPDQFNEAFRLAYPETDPVRGKTIVQQHGNRFVIQYPLPPPLPAGELDRIYSLPYARAWHPAYDAEGGVPGLATVKFSIVSHRGCAGECHFCALYAHQGRMIQSRSRESILKEARLLASLPDFKGTISDIGGPTANLYGASCGLWERAGACRNKKCLVPRKCDKLRLGLDETVALWREVMKIPGVKHLFVSSGLRYDLLLDREAEPYLEALCADHVSGQLKVAPEHCSSPVLDLMNKCRFEFYEKFVEKFDAMNRKAGKKQFLVNYFLSAHPGTTLSDALELALYLEKRHIQPEQIQDFIPLPMTVSGCMYYTGKHPFTGEKVHVPRDLRERQMQRALVQYKQAGNKKWVREALKILGRPDLERVLVGRGGSRDFSGPRRPPRR